MKRQEITVRIGNILKTYSYEEVLANHGGEMPGGVALAFRMFQWVFEDVLQANPEQGNCTFYSGLGKNGRGIIDTAKQILGVIEGKSLRLDVEYCKEKSGPAAPGGGRYYFEVGCGEKLVKLAVRDEVIPKEFFDFSAEMHRKRLAGEEISERERMHLQELRADISRLILAAEREELFKRIK